MQCYQCQADIPDDAEFCIACGKPQSRAATEPTDRIYPPPTTGSTGLLNPSPALLQALNDLPRQLRERIQTELAPGECIYWVDQPVPLFFPVAFGCFGLLGILWIAMVIVLLGAAVVIGVPSFLLFLLKAILLGFVLLLLPLWIWCRPLQTIYLITDQRAMIIEGRWPTTVSSFSPDQFDDVHRRQNRDGTWDLIITTKCWRRFEGLGNAEEAERQLKELQQRYLTTGYPAPAPPYAISPHQAP